LQFLAVLGSNFGRGSTAVSLRRIMHTNAHRYWKMWAVSWRLTDFCTLRHNEVSISKNVSPLFLPTGGERKFFRELSLPPHPMGR